MTKEDDINKIKNFSLALRKNIIDMAFAAGASSSHLGWSIVYSRNCISIIFI